MRTVVLALFGLLIGIGFASATERSEASGRIPIKSDKPSSETPGKDPFASAGLVKVGEKEEVRSANNNSIKKAKENEKPSSVGERSYSQG